MPISKRRQYRFKDSGEKPRYPVFDFSQGVNTRDQDVAVTIRVGRNVRFGRSSGFRKRKGSAQKGNSIGTATKVLGLHSYVRKSTAAQLLATYGSDIYQYTDTPTPTVAGTSTSAQATGLSKDRHVFLTSSLDASGFPYAFITYQSGAGLSFRYASYPYSSWSAATVIDATVQAGWSLCNDPSDNAYVAYMDTANSVRYVKLSFAAGPSWSVGTKQPVSGTGASDRAISPTVCLQASGRIHVAYTSYNGTSYVNAARLSNDAGATWSAPVAIGTPGSAATYAVAAVTVLDTPYFVVQEDTTGTGTSYGYSQFLWNGNYLYQSYLGFYGTQTLATFSVVSTASAVQLYAATGAAPDGLGATQVSGTSRRDYAVVTDGANDTDIQYRNAVGGTEDAVATRSTNDTNRNRYPSVPLAAAPAAPFVPVMFQEGTASPYNVRVTSPVQWAALGAGLTSGKNMESAYFPLTGAGGTDAMYFSNGTDAVRKWDGTSLTTVTATGYPVAKIVLSYDNRLWFWNLFNLENRGAYTPLGSDNFTGTFPSGNTIDLPAYVTWAMVYRDRQQLVFTREGIYSIQNFDYTGANVGPEVIRRIPSSYGTLSGRTVRQVGDWVYFQSPDGQIRRTNGQWVENPAVSDIVRPTMDGMALSQLTNACAGQLVDYYYLGSTSSGSGTNDTWTVLDTVQAGQNSTYNIAGQDTSSHGGGFSFDTGKYTSCFVTHPDSNGVPTLYWGDARTGTVYQGETGGSDAGAAIDMDVQTGTLQFGDSFYKKEVRDAVVLADASGNWNLTFSYARGANTGSFTDTLVSLSPGGVVWGGFTWGSFTWGGSTGIQRRVYMGVIDRGFKFRFRNNAANQDVSVQGYTLSYELVNDAI